MTTSFTDVTDEEQLFVTGTYNQNESEEQTLEEKEQYRKAAGQWVANEEPSSLRISMKESINIDGDSTSFPTNGVKAKTQTQADQNLVLTLKKLKPKLPGQL